MPASDTLKVTLLQTNPLWEDKAANRDTINRLTESLSGTDLLLLPEMFSTGFTMRTAEVAEPMDGPTVKWMQNLAEVRNSVVAGSLVIQDKDRYVNRLVWVSPDQTLQWYDKRHLFTMGEEPLHFYPGAERVSIDWLGWRFRLLVCYDLRFPVWSRNNDGYDVLVYLANWPSARHYVWKTLLLARAVENQSYCIGLNRVGIDGMGIHYNGGSAVISPRGKAAWLGNTETVSTFTLSYTDLHSFRAKFPVLDDRDSFTLSS